MLSTAVKNTSADPEYHEILRGLSEGSVHKNFDPYVDIDWDSPEFAVDPTDTRWIMPDEDPLGRHPWYKAQPVERKIAMGMRRQAGIAKVGLDFERLLIRGLMQYLVYRSEPARKAA